MDDNKKTTGFFCKEAETEAHFTAGELMDEIKILIPDYFLCTMEGEGDAFTMRFPNGQTFKLTAQEIK